MNTTLESKIQLAESLREQLKAKDIQIRISFDLKEKVEELVEHITNNTELTIKDRSLEKQESQLDAYITLAQDMLSGKFDTQCTSVYSTSFTPEQIEDSKKKFPWFYGN